jgi:hypothetical protein
MTTASAEDQVADALTAGAGGEGTTEAAVMLLAGCGFWLDREDFASRFITGGDGGDATPPASIDWEAAVTALDAGELPCTGGEQRILRLAASLAAGTPVSLSDALPRAGERDAAPAVAAIAHAAGQTWLSDGGLGEHADLLTTLDNFLRSSPKVTDALAAFMAGTTSTSGTGLANPVYAASLLLAEVSFAALWFQQIAGRACGGPVDRVGIKFS